MGRMYIQPTEEEFDIAVERFLNTYTEFERAAKKLTAIMESMNKKRYQELKILSEESQRIYLFLIQMMDDTGQIKERCFGIRYMANKEKK